MGNFFIYINTKFQNNKITKFCTKNFGEPKFIFYRYSAIDDLKPFLCFWKKVLVYDDFLVTDYRGDVTKISKNSKISKVNSFNFIYPTTKHYHIEYNEDSSIFIQIPIIYANAAKKLEEYFNIT